MGIPKLVQVRKDDDVLSLDISGHVNGASPEFVFVFFILQHYCLTSPVAPERAASSCGCTAPPSVVHNFFFFLFFLFY